MQRIAIPAALVTSLLTLLAFSILPADIWDNFRPATCINDGCFCEAANPHSPIRQAANTVSSLGFVFSGALMMVYKRSPSKRLPIVHSYIMGFACIIIGLGSAFYHASLTFIGQFLDVFGMFLLAVFMLVYAFERIWTLRLPTTIGLFLTINIFLSGLQIAVPDTRRYVFAVVLIVALFFEAYFRKKTNPRIDVKPLRLGIGLLAIAYIIWILDNTRTLCFETSLLQGHALWHLLGAVSVWMLHRYYVSEKIFGVSQLAGELTPYKDES
jgi:hypothetical protein